MTEPLPSPTELLAARAREGDPVALRALVLVLQPRVRNLVRYLVRSDEQVDDLAQQSLLTALERLPAYRGEGRIEAWLDGIVLRVTLRGMRRLRLWRARQVEHLDDRLSSDEPTPGYTQRRKLVHALDRVPEKQRAAVVMHHVLGMSAREIGELESIPEETARSRLKHGMAALRQAFGIREESP